MPVHRSKNPEEYDVRGDLKYNPRYHFAQKKPWDEKDLEYLCKFHQHDGYSTVGMALGRTARCCKDKVSYLKKMGLYKRYRTQDKYWV